LIAKASFSLHSVLEDVQIMSKLALSILQFSSTIATSGAFAIAQIPAYAQASEDNCPSYQGQELPQDETGVMLASWYVDKWSDFLCNCFWTPIPVC
jgi:hypothetical protein